MFPYRKPLALQVLEVGRGPAPPPHKRNYATETNATVQQQQKTLGHQREDCPEASNMTLEDQSRKEVRKPKTSLLRLETNQ